MIWMLRKPETYLALALALGAAVCQAEQGQFAPTPQGQLYQPPPQVVQPPPVYVYPPPIYVPTPGYWTPVRRPTFVGNLVFGPLWVFTPAQPVQPQGGQQ